MKVGIARRNHGDRDSFYIPMIYKYLQVKIHTLF
ncbi:hypothetical protein EMST110833_14505 [Empedobacter stercoris]